MKIPKRFRAQKYAKNEVDYWKRYNKSNVQDGYPEATLEQMLELAWLKGFESGRREEKEKAKLVTDVTNPEAA